MFLVEAGPNWEQYTEMMLCDDIGYAQHVAKSFATKEYVDWVTISCVAVNVDLGSTHPIISYNNRAEASDWRLRVVRELTEEEVEQLNSYYKKGLHQRVQIIEVVVDVRVGQGTVDEFSDEEKAYRQKMIGQLGTIVGFATIDHMYAPKIQLDNGDVLWGFECWWLQVE